VNKKIVRALAAHGTLNPIGLSGEDGRILRATRNEQLGFVAQEICAYPTPIIDLCLLGYTPVVAPLALDESGHPLNANTDEVACAIASALGIDEMIFLTNVPGVVVEGEVKSVLSALEAERLIALGSITVGMIVKVRSALEFARQSGSRIRICNLESLNAGGGTLVEHSSQFEPRSLRVNGNSSELGSSQSLAPLFAKLPTRMNAGNGMWLRDPLGKQYLDFGSGIAVNALGHQHPRIVQTLMRKARAAVLVHKCRLSTTCNANFLGLMQPLQEKLHK